tara:strand:+ start:664 stop:891 length:228 start_codon:yes stop_codon:yes gene_type:complete
LNVDSSVEQIKLFAQLANFVNEFDSLGVYFAPLHPGNIVFKSAGELSLIDISEMHCMNHPLSTGMRNRNYQHLLR